MLLDPTEIEVVAVVNGRFITRLLSTNKEPEMVRVAVVAADELPIVRLPHAAAYPEGMVTIRFVEASPINTWSPETGIDAPDPPPLVEDQVEVRFHAALAEFTA